MVVPVVCHRVLLFIFRLCWLFRIFNLLLTFCFFFVSVPMVVSGNVLTVLVILYMSMGAIANMFPLFWLF